jgi:hypothetical protein
MAVTSWLETILGVGRKRLFLPQRTLQHNACHCRGWEVVIGLTEPGVSCVRLAQYFVTVFGGTANAGVASNEAARTTAMR